MARVYISCGSNIDPQPNLLAGLRDLHRQTGNLTLSPVYESTAVGFDGENFLNLVAAFDTTLDVQAVDAMLDQIEKQNGRIRNSVRFSSRNIDFDLLLYDDLIFTDDKLTLPRPEIYTNAFVLAPLADIAPDLPDPISQQTFACLWSKFNDPSQKLWVYDSRSWGPQIVTPADTHY